MRSAGENIKIDANALRLLFVEGRDDEVFFIEELRDSFPVQLMVEKTSKGSQVTLRSA